MKYETYTRNIPRFTDSMHGWLLVSVTELASLNILADITEYSYVAKQADGSIWVYLEEDQDATTYLNALESRGISYSIQEPKHHGISSWIRYLAPFKFIKSNIGGV